ncbi:hypothetical protein HS7_18930 [Sulfolobales archaeon HS-7]|nr:hypothetical protein HS7_18930 [Sulfolobales archaeon HS-7]
MHLAIRKINEKLEINNVSNENITILSAIIKYSTVSESPTRDISRRYITSTLDLNKNVRPGEKIEINVLDIPISEISVVIGSGLKIVRETYTV